MSSVGSVRVSVKWNRYITAIYTHMQLCQKDCRDNETPNYNFIIIFIIFDNRMHAGLFCYKSSGRKDTHAGKECNLQLGILP